MSLWNDQKRLNSGILSEGRKAVEVGPNSGNTGITFTTDEDAVLKLQSLGVVDKHLPGYSFTENVDIEVRIEYEVHGVEDEFREPKRIKVNGNRQIVCFEKRQRSSSRYLEQYTVAVILKKSSLAFGEPSDVNRAVCFDSHPLQQRFVRSPAAVEK